MKLFYGILLSFAVGVICRFFDIPVGSPPVLPGAVLVVAMTLGYTGTNTLMNRHGKSATTAHLCGGPTGRTAPGASDAQAALGSPTPRSSE